MNSISRHPAARWRTALPGFAAVALLLAGCGSSSPASRSSSASGPRPVPSSSSRSGTPVSATPASALAATLSAALRTMEQINSYRFTAEETLSAARSVRSLIVGEVVTGEGVAYRLTVGHRQTQVVRLPGMTYLRTVPGHWSRISRAQHLADPSATLLGVLRALQPVTVTIAPHGQQTVRGDLAADAATTLGIPAHGAAARVSATLDAAGHVVSLTIRAVTSSDGQPIAVLVHATYSNFNQIKPIQRPA